jgi:hypothetical protein
MGGRFRRTELRRREAAGCCLAAAALLACCLCGCSTVQPGRPAPAADGGQSGAFQLELRESAGVDRQGEAVRAGLPFPPGALYKTICARVVLSDGREVPSQRSALAHWPDGSIRWLELIFEPSVVAGGVGYYRVEFSPRIRPARIARPLVAVREKGVIAVNTGRIKLEVDEGRGALQAWLDRDGDGRFSREEQVLVGPGIESFVELDALAAGAAEGGFSGAPTGAAELEEAGPLRAAIVWRGWHVGAGGRVCPYTLRLEAFRGSGCLRLVRTVVLSEPPVLSRVAESGLALVLPPGRAPLPELRLEQECTEPRRYPDFAGSRTRSRLWEGRGPAVEGGARGFMDLRNDELALAAALPRPVEDVPWQLRVDPAARRLVASFWTRAGMAHTDARSPDRRTGSGFAEFSRTESCERFWETPADDHGVGAARTHELWVSFGVPGAGPGEGAQLAARLAAPLVPWPGAAWLRRARAFGDFEGEPPEGPAAEWEGGGERLKAWLRRHQRDRFGWLGLWDYGDFQTVYRAKDGLDVGERWWNWHGRWGWMQGRSGLCGELLVPWLRSGRAGDWELFRAAACHNLDVDTVHAPAPRGQLVGATHGPGATHWSAPAALAATWPSVWLDLHYLAGERRALEMLGGLIGSLGDKTMADFAVPGEAWSRDQAGYLRARLAAHEAFGGDYAPAAAAALSFFAGLSARDLAAGDWAGDLAPALIRYHRFCGDAAAARMIDRGTRAWLAQTGQPPEAAAGAGVGVCAYAWRLSRDRFFLERGRQLAAQSDSASAAAAARRPAENEPPLDLVTDMRALLELGALPYLESALRDSGEGRAGRSDGSPDFMPGPR